MEASILCLENGADFIKTSTGKIEKGADIYSSTVMLLALREYYRKNNVLKGLKVAGGIRKIEEAVEYMNLYKYFITSNFDNNSFRIGCSQLFDKIKEELLKNN
jgi:deoxyribose-phosphate aldolase